MPLGALLIVSLLLEKPISCYIIVVMDSKKSPIIQHLSWGKMKIEGFGEGRDFKLFPGGARAWDWKETNMHHVPGIQIEDVEELLNHGSQIVVLSRGIELRLQTCPETLKYLESKGVRYFVEETTQAAETYNRLAESGAAVGGLFHSTC